MYQNQLALGKLIYGPKSSTPNAGLKTPQECYYTMQFEIKEQQPINGGKKSEAKFSLNCNPPRTDP